MSSVHEPSAAYEIRYGWTSLAWWALGLALLVAVALVPGATPSGDTPLELLLVPFAAAPVLVASCRRTAVRIGPKGITLGAVLFVRRAKFVPWSQIVAVTYDEEKAAGKLKHALLEVRHRKGAAPPWEPAGSPAVHAIDTYLSTNVAAEFLETFRGTETSTHPMTLCTVDPALLRRTVQAFAPEVHVFGYVDDVDLGPLNRTE